MASFKHLTEFTGPILFVVTFLSTILETSSIPTPAIVYNDVSNVCLTKSCILTASNILESIDPSADPCNDFYQYACGGWIDNNEIPDDKSSYGIAEVLQAKVRQSMKQIIETKSKASEANSVDVVNKLISIYLACMNETEIERLGLQTALKFLAENAPWPAVMMAEFNETAYDLVDALANFTTRLTTSALIDVGLATDDKNITRHVIRLDQSSLGMPSSEYLKQGWNDSMVQAYLQYMTSVAKLVRQEQNLTDDMNILDNEMHQVLEFEINVATIMTPREDRRDPNRMYNNMTIAELARKVPGFDWLTFLRKIFAEVSIVIDETEMVIVSEPEYFNKLVALLERTPRRTVANYLAWRAMKDVVEYLSKDLNKIRLDYASILTGAKKQKPRWEMCVENAMNSLDMVAARLYVDRHFDRTSKKLATEMMLEIQHAFEQQLAEQDWMEPKEHELAKQKSNAMIKLIAYPDSLLNDTWLTDRYAEYVGSTDKHLENYVKNGKADEWYAMRKLRQPVDRYEFDMSPAEINAYYQPSSNIIVFLAAIMQPPYFTPDQPMSINYGAIFQFRLANRGAVMGHELTHGFDDQGRHYDSDGMLNDWWSNKTAGNYESRTQCLIDQFNNFTIEGGPLHGMRLNGITTQGENIADLGGLRQSYMAYRNWLAKQINSPGQEPISIMSEQRRLPGLYTYTDEQLFFLGNAVSWCSKDRPEALKLAILSDEHCPDKYRINGPVANMPEFARAFNCPSGSRMNPEKKCRVW